MGPTRRYLYFHYINMDKKVKLLIITQKVDSNDPILGFFIRWIEEFAKHTEKLTVICLEEGEYDLPDNVKVLSLGKKKYFREEVQPRGGAERQKRSFLEEKIFSKAIYLVRFYKYIWQERKNYDAVFVHMNPIYVILGGIFWRAMGKKISLWYTHKQVDLKLRIAEKLVHTIFTASKKSFRLESPKVNVMGHGIDTNVFRPRERSQDDTFRIITVGRVTPVKDYETLLKTAEILKKEGKGFSVTIIGSYIDDSQKEYLESLKKYVVDHGLEKEVIFAGALPHIEIARYLQESDLFVNMSNTGSLDKAILEAMSCGIAAMTSNEAYEDMLSSYEGLFFQNGDHEEFSKNIVSYMSKTDEEKLKIKNTLREEVVKTHDLGHLMGRIVDNIEMG
ncbi:MAG TPA: glycosyltransferase [Candidatus Yonathbacteria bacterium]|nr:glycosyltransferase [Candidatus Yonathbacteria bacterium]